MTAAEKEYRRVRSNLLRQIRSMKARGYFFPDGDPVPKPPKKKTTASVNRLKQIQKDLYKKARWIDPETGKETSGVRGREIEHEKRGKKSWETRTGDTGGAPPIPPIITMYERIKQDLENRKTDVYIPGGKGRRGVHVNFDNDCIRCLQILNSLYATDPEGYEVYLSENEEEIMELLDASSFTVEFMSDISGVVDAYSELYNVLSAGAPDAPGDITTDDNGFITGEYELPFY